MPAVKIRRTVVTVTVCQAAHILGYYIIWTSLH